MGPCLFRDGGKGLDARPWPLHVSHFPVVAEEHCMPNRLIAFLAATVAVPALAQTSSHSAPQATPIVNSIPAARDIAYPGGTITLNVDLTDTQRGIFRVKQRVPVAAAGPMTLLYPEWLPGNHQPSGQINKLVGLKISAGGKPVAWRRDPVDVYAFHVDVPTGAAALDLDFQFVSPTDAGQGRIVSTPDMLNLQWEAVALYPAGYYTRRLVYDASVTLPAGWKGYTALDVASAAGSTIHYKPISFDHLVDSPMFAGRFSRSETLAPGVRLNVVADNARELAITPDQLAAHKRIVEQAVKLFGSQHYDHYDFLLAISDRQGGIGLEHHRSSENGVKPGYFIKWDDSVTARTLLPHEMTHSWNGKFRRPAALWTPDFRTPMQNELLWVYEGQTQFWGQILSARSGVIAKEDVLGSLATIAASLDTRPGRQWRPLVDTTDDPIMADRPPLAWRDWQRSEDYYNEGALVWLEADAIIRAESGGKRSIDDFAKAFFGMRDRDWGELTYSFDDVVKTLNDVQPHDWATFLRTRVYDVNPASPLAGFTRNGYTLAYTAEPTNWWKKSETARKVKDLSYSGGLAVGDDGVVSSVVWDSPAFDAGLTVGSTIVAIDGVAYAGDGLVEAVRDAQGTSTPVKLLVKNGAQYRELALDWHGGLRYPRLEKTGKGVTGLDRLLSAR
jgi:predicted metalloprotease with PDZ domain